VTNPGAEIATRDNGSVPAVQQSAPAKTPVQLVGPQGDLDQAYRLAQALAHSQLVPESLRGKPSDILVITLYGQELNLPPMQAMQVIDVVKGRPTLRANLWVALTRKAGHKVRIMESTADSCTVTVVRHDDPDGPVTATYTMADAKLAGLTTNANYQKNPKAMLYARAASTAIRQACPEVAMGFSDEYELNDVPAPVNPGSPLAAVVQQQPAPAQPAPTADDYADIVDENGALFGSPGGES
jgi:hypothetical protein